MDAEAGERRSMVEIFGSAECYRWVRLLAGWAEITIGSDWHKNFSGQLQAIGSWRELIEMSAGLLKPGPVKADLMKILSDTFGRGSDKDMRKAVDQLVILGRGRSRAQIQELENVTPPSEEQKV